MTDTDHELLDLRVALAAEKVKTASLTQEVARLRETVGKLVSGTEAEEEFLTNKLIKRMEELKEEKEKLAVDIMREEEFLTNTLQRKLAQVQKEKQDLENQLEAEQEFLVNKLQAQMDALRAENSKLDRAVKQDKIIVERLTAQLQQASEEKSKMQTTLRTEESLLTQMQAKLSKLGKEKVEIENQLEAEQEYVTNRLQKQLEHVEREKRDLESKLHGESLELISHMEELLGKLLRSASGAQVDLLARMNDEVSSIKRRHESYQQEYSSFKERNAALQAEIDRLKDENFALSQQVKAEEEVAVQARSEAGKAFVQIEFDTEREFNNQSRSHASSVDDTGVPPSPTLSFGRERSSSGSESLDIALHGHFHPGHSLNTPPLPVSLQALESSPARRQSVHSADVLSLNLGLSEEHGPGNFLRSSSFSRTLVDSPILSAACATAPLGVPGTTANVSTTASEVGVTLTPPHVAPPVKSFPLNA